MPSTNFHFGLTLPVMTVAYETVKDDPTTSAVFFRLYNTFTKRAVSFLQPLEVIKGFLASSGSVSLGEASHTLSFPLKKA